MILCGREIQSGMADMKLFLFAIIQLTLVTLVYIFAYRNGYKASLSKTEAMVKEFSNPVTALLDQLNEMVDQPGDESEKGRTTNDEWLLTNY